MSAALAGAISRYAQEPSTDHLFAVLAFPKLALRTPMVRGRFSHDHFVSTLRTRLQTF
jgi:hypothetical protein